MHWAVFESAGDVKDMGREIGNVSANVGRQLVHGAADFNRSLAGAAQSFSDNLFGPDSAPSRYFKGVQDWVKWARPDEVRADSFLGQLGYDFVRSAPQQLGNIMAAATNPVAALSLMGVQISGGSYANLRDQGVSPGRALVSSLTNTVAQAPLEKLGLDRFMSIFRSSSFRDTIVRTLGTTGTEMVTEYLQKWPEAVTELWALAEKESDDVAEQVHWFGSRLSDAETLARINREGAYEGLIGGMWGLFGGGVRSLAIRDIERQKAADFARQNMELHGAVEATQTKQVAPDHMADALASASDVLAQSVYIPAQAALDMAAQGQDILTPLGISAEQVQQALASGADLEVSLATLQSRLDSAGMESVAQIMRQTADAPNALEAAQVDSAAQAQAVVEDARRRQRQIDVVRQEEARLVKQMTPLVGKDAAETYGALHASQARAFEAAYGLDAAGLMTRRSIELADEDAGVDGEKTFYQAKARKRKKYLNSIESVRNQHYGTDSWMKAPNGKETRLTEEQWLRVRTPEFKSWFGDWENNPEESSKILDENGEPLILYHRTSAEFDAFDISIGSGIAGQGVYATDIKPTDDSYGPIELVLLFDIKNPVDFSSGDEAISAMAKKLRLKKLSELGSLQEVKKWSADLRTRLKKKGYDGAILKGARDGETYYVSLHFYAKWVVQILSMFIQKTVPLTRIILKLRKMQKLC